MRVLVTTIPGLGHFHPMVPLARALVTAGHEVRVGCSESFAEHVRAAGLEPMVAGPDWVESEVDQLYPGFTMSGGSDQLRVFADLPKRGLVTDLIEKTANWRPDVVVHDHLELGGWILGELLDIPSAPYAMTVRLLEPEMLRLTLGEPVGELLRHFDLPPDPDLRRPSRWLYLDSIPPSFASLFMPPGPTVHAVRYCTDDRTGREVLPEWVSSRRDRPLVYVTLGTVFNQLPGVLSKLAEGAAALDVDVIVTTGRNVEPESPAPLPDNAHVERYVPQAELIPRCDVVVCHGGFNTVFASLSCGKPVVIVPFSADQPMNAFLCQENGLGVSCTTELPEGALFPLTKPYDVTADQITVALDKVLSDPSYAAAAGKMRDEIASQPGVERGVELLERLVATGEPVLREQDLGAR